MKCKWNKSTGRNNYKAIIFVAEKMQRGKHTKSNITKCEWNRIWGFLKPVGIHYCTTQHNNPDDQNRNSKKHPGQNHHKINWVKNRNGQDTSKPSVIVQSAGLLLLLYASSYYKIMATNLSCRICALYSSLSTIFHCLCAPFSPLFVHIYLQVVHNWLQSMYSKKHRVCSYSLSDGWYWSWHLQTSIHMRFPTELTTKDLRTFSASIHTTKFRDFKSITFKMLIQELSFIMLLYKLINANTSWCECHAVCRGTSENLSSHHMNRFVWTASTYVQYTAYYKVSFPRRYLTVSAMRTSNTHSKANFCSF